MPTCTRSPSRAAIRLTYSRLPPVTVRHWGEFVTVSMPWLAKKRIRYRAGKSRMVAGDDDHTAPVSGSMKWSVK